MRDITARHTGPVHILHLEDSELDAELILIRLNDDGLNFSLKRVWSRQDYVDALTSQRFDVILADHQLPNFDGEKALEIARQIAPDLPFIFVSGTLGEDVAVEALKRGAIDYVVKQRLDRLPRVIRRALAEARERTERARAEASLRDSDARLRLALQAGRLAQITFHAPEMRLSHSPEFAALMGLPKGTQVTFERFQAALHPDELDRVLADQKSILYDKQRRTYHSERHIIWPDGTEHWLYGVGRVDRDADGNPTELVAVYSDITEQKLAEKALREVNENLERIVEERTRALAEGQAQISTILETSMVLLCMLGPDGQLIYANPASLALIERNLEDVEGVAFWDSPWFADTDGMPDYIRTLVAKVGGGANVREEITLKLPDGWRIFDFNIRPVIGPDGGVIAIIPESVDITERRQAELALRQSQKLEAMGQLTGGVAHDFNNLLTPIVGSLDLLQRQGVGSDRHKRLIDGALQSAERARTLVHRLLAFARRQPLQPVPVDLAKLVTNMAELIASTSGPRIKIDVQVNHDMPPALADAHQVEMAILNLCVNARDAMADGGRLTISADSRTIRHGEVEGLRAGHYVRLSVADSGCGMDEATLAKAIEPFFSTKGIGKGTGLGLSMVHGLASQLGGALRIASKPGLGTDVALWLPVSRSCATDDNADDDVAPITLAAGNALVVDDESLVRASTCDMLSELGYSVTEASSAEEALDLLESDRRFDLLVTDHLMMGMSGTELVRTASSRWCDMQVLLVSGYAETDGVDHDIPRLNKPFRQADLAAALARL